jgi:uncharacterized repeat protein (TIGR02543 family)
MKTRATSLIALIAVISIVAIGIGYAISYASTESSENNSNVKFITVTQQDENENDKYSFTGSNGTDIELDTFNMTNADTMYYKLNSTSAVTMNKSNFPSYTFIELGEVYLAAEYHGSGNAPSPLYVTLKTGSTRFEASDSWVYFLTNDFTVNDHTTSDIEIYAYKNNAANQPWSAGPDQLTLTTSSTGYDRAKILLCYGYPTALATVDFDANDAALKGYLRTTVAPVKLEDGSVIFSVSDTEPATSNTYAVTYDSNIGTGSLQYVVLTNSTSVTLVSNDNVTKFENAGHNFVGWNADKTSNTALDASQTITGNTTFYAIWN